jgi:hypothetical protein
VRRVTFFLSIQNSSDAAEVQANATASEGDRLSEEEVIAQITYAIIHSRMRDSEEQGIFPEC